MEDSRHLLASRADSASLTSSVFNLLNTMIGAGMLGLPRAFAACGFVTGTGLLFAAAALAAFGLHLLSEAADATKRPASFYSVAEAAVPGLGLVIEASIFGACFGSATGYLIIVGDSMPAAMASFGFAGAALDRRPWILLAAALVTPLSFLRSVDQLSHTSLIALACVALIAIMTVVFAFGTEGGVIEPCDPDAPDCRGHVVPFAGGGRAILRAVPVFVFAFTCHQNVLSITNELREPSRGRVLRLAVVTVGVRTPPRRRPLFFALAPTFTPASISAGAPRTCARVRPHASACRPLYSQPPVPRRRLSSRLSLANARGPRRATSSSSSSRRRATSPLATWWPPTSW